ncbi:MAG: asparagine synthase (glutamine-hydrolyzing) [endosymbiont of Galathealinum brachiosum]|uniref:asparagine synthase (glutamine-hydrolyzing) n=1 Tax=endosymbiont of Galathealinum brachiosum TaxID=2200906 RepID=A0A370DL87_9GAMM|nr:MAG: asparagine synthase (glutamine-hydrolyzing) [endosymbiont of Galathealinum brachiosum]
MCGILSIFSTNHGISEESVKAGLDTLYHRGPDHQSFWMSNDKRVALGHTRLSIIDLNTGDQPISNSSNTVHLVANGEFYDFEEIRDDLIKKGHIFKTKSDSEIALHLYHEYGTSCLSHLRGEFAFCIWDSNNQQFFAARDRFGIKPLFYAQHNGKIYFASEIKALLSAGVPAIWDEDAYVSRAFFFRDRTLFKNIHQVPPGHFLIATNGGIRIIKYWDFDYCKTDKYTHSTDEKEIIEDIKEELNNSVKTRLRADVPVGVYLSGGIDSCAVIGMAAEHHNQPIDAFTISFDNKDYDETDLAREMADRVDAKFNSIAVNQLDLADNFSDAIWHSEALCLNSHGVAKYLLSKAVSEQGFKVVLTGEGSDEIFGGYSAFRSDMLLYNSENQDKTITQKLLNELKERNKVSSGLLLAVGKPENVEFINKMLGFEPAWLMPLAESIDRLKGLYNLSTRTNMGSLHPIHQFLSHTDVTNQIHGIEPVHASMYLLSKSALCNYVFPTLGDRMEMAHSLEGRLPLIDHKVVEKVTQLPVSLKIKGITEKYILREATKPYLIDKVYNREKHPFLAPPSILDPEDKLHQLVQDTLRGPLLKSLPFFDQRKIIKYLDDLPKLDNNMKIGAEALLMELLSLCMLQKHFH